ncbi:unnamed protein product [Paramecium sonneborni]|uniref:Uncharacterized protein n=1 Tax=Paramecium sonneborni TaxID=65129 RepID=A0A8S1QRT1_9CILI|nr:unnamed protein product [Paramecium sonneborni]
MQHSNLLDFSFSVQNQKEADIEKQMYCLRINSSANISSDEENDLDKKIKQLYSKTKQALQSFDQQQIKKKVKGLKNQSNFSSQLVCSKSLPQVQLFFVNKMFCRDHKIKGLTAIQSCYKKESLEKCDNGQQQQKSKTKQKLQYNSSFSIPNRKICYSQINN